MRMHVKDLAELEKSALSIEVSQQEAGQNTGLLAADSRNVSHTGEDLVYQTLYPELYVEKPDEFVPVYDAERFFYFTFHGGPSEATEKILDELLALDIKATFFVSAKEGTKNAEILNRIVEEGHSIGIYSGGESANRVYQSVETYLADFYKAFTYVEEQTGVRPSVFRFCSGTVNKYNVPVREQLTARCCGADSFIMIGMPPAVIRRPMQKQRTLLERRLKRRRKNSGFFCCCMMLFLTVKRRPL